MELSEILSKCDHTLLSQTAIWENIKAICDDGMKFKTASVCIPACFVRQAKEYVQGKLAICTVIGFPNGYATTAAKCFMAYDAVGQGADEIDMVINIGWVKEGKFDAVLEEIKQVKAHCCGKLLKVIIETCLLTEEEKIQMCRIVTEAGADYIKTSTGFSTGGATFADVELFAKHIGKHVKIKAAGGISSLEDAEKFIELGASRLGTSRIVKIAKQEKGAAEADHLMRQAIQRACENCPERETCPDKKAVADMPSSVLYGPLFTASLLPVQCQYPGRVLMELHKSKDQLQEKEGNGY